MKKLEEIEVNNQGKTELLTIIESINCDTKIKVIYIFVKSFLSSFRS